MTSQEPSNPVAHRLVAAINDGGRDAFPATLTPHATLTDDGNPRSLDDWIDREIFSAHGHMSVEHEMAGLPQSEISHPASCHIRGGITGSRTGIGLCCQSGRIVRAHPADGGSASSPPTMPTLTSADPSPGGITDGHVAREHPEPR